MLSPHAAYPPPETCDVCESNRVRLLKTRVTYSEQHADWPYRYSCADCHASVGCHSHTLSPLGLMAQRSVRRLRVQAHVAFDPIWKDGFMTRTEAYEWLAETFGLAYSELHIGNMTKEQLETTIRISRQQHTVLKRRREKEQRKNEKRLIRKRQRNNRGGRRR